MTPLLRLLRRNLIKVLPPILLLRLLRLSLTEIFLIPLDPSQSNLPLDLLYIFSI